MTRIRLVLAPYALLLVSLIAIVPAPACAPPKLPAALEITEDALYAYAQRELKRRAEVATDERRRVLEQIAELLALYRRWRDGETTPRQTAIDALHTAVDLLDSLR